MELKIDEDIGITVETFEDTSGQWIKATDFKTFIKSGVRKFDKQNINIWNFDRTVKQFTKTIHSTEYISLSDVFQYIYNKRKWIFCQYVCKKN